MYIMEVGKKHLEFHLSVDDKIKLYRALRPEVDSLLEHQTAKNAVLYAIVLGMYYSLARGENAAS